MDNKENATELSFEAAMARLEEISQKLESGRAPLDESMKYYEEGVKLIAFCRAKLADARQKVVDLGAGAEEN